MKRHKKGRVTLHSTWRSGTEIERRASVIRTVFITAICKSISASANSSLYLSISAPGHQRRDTSQNDHSYYWWVLLMDTNFTFKKLSSNCYPFARWSIISFTVAYICTPNNIGQYCPTVKMSSILKTQSKLTASVAHLPAMRHGSWSQGPHSCRKQLCHGKYYSIWQLKFLRGHEAVCLQRINLPLRAFNRHLLSMYYELIGTEIRAN